MNIQLFVNIFTCFFEALIMFKLFNAFLEKRNQITALYEVCGVIGLTILIRVSNLIFGFGIMNTVGIVVAIFVASFLYESRVSIRAMISVIGVLLATVMEIIVLFAVAYLLKMSTTEIVSNPMTSILGTVLSKIFTYIAFTMICSKGKNISKKGTEYWIMFFVVFMTAVLAVVVFFNLSYSNPNENLYDITVICSFGILISAILTFYLYDRMLEQQEVVTEKKVYEQQLKDQTRYFDEILVAQEDMKRFRHDFLNHIISIRQYFLAEDTDGGVEYIDKINKIMENKGSSINTGNIALDAILNAKKSLALSKNIEFETNLQIPENLNIDPADICIIFGNALDNAIEACDMIEKHDGRRIKIDLIYDTDSLTCKIVNTCENDRNSGFLTSKKDKNNHGYGIANIRSALKKYKHLFKIKRENNEFLLSFVIFR